MSQSLYKTKEEKNTEIPANKTERSIKTKLVWLVIAFLVLLVGLIAGVVLLVRSDNATTSHIRDVLIIIVALESLIIGASLVILVVQLALLLNLLQNEIKPILDSTRETINTMKGTTAFLSEHAVKPVINISSFGAGLKKVIGLIGIIRK